MKTVDKGDGRVYDRNWEAAFNAPISNGIRRTSKNTLHTHTPLSQKSKKAKHPEDYSPPIAYAHMDCSSLTCPLPHRERAREVYVVRGKTRAKRVRALAGKNISI